VLTRNGVAVAGSAVGLLAAGMWADYPELVTLGLAAFGALLTAVPWLIAQPRLTVERETRSVVYEGSAARGLLTITNVGRRHSPLLLATETVGGHRITVPIPALADGRSYQVRYPIPTTRRGRYVIPPLTLSRSDPLRLLHRGRVLGTESVLHVYPRVHPLAVAPAGGPRDAEGPTASSVSPDGVAFHSLREYAVGDDWRLIHWGATARTGTLMARNLVVSDEPRQLVVLDTSAASYTTTLFEDAVRVAASFCVAAAQAGSPVQVRTTGNASGEWRADLTTILEQLSVVETSGTDRGLVALLDTVRDIVSADHGVALVVVTGPVQAHQAELLARVRPRFLSVGLAQLVPAGPTPPVRPRGVLAVAASTSAEFTASWNRLVLR
jgi:uncharacterized protein (DUF58 family)